MSSRIGGIAMRLQYRVMLVLAAVLMTVHACDCGWGQETRPDAGPDAGPPDAGPPDAGPPDAGPPDAGLPDAGPCADLGESCSNATGPRCCGDLRCWQGNAGLACQDCFGLGHACTSGIQCCPGTSCADIQTSGPCQADAGCICVVILP